MMWRRWAFPVLVIAPRPRACPARILTRDGAAVAHQLPRRRKSGERADFHYNGHGRHFRDAAQRLERLDHRRGGLRRLVDRALESRDALAHVLNLVEVVHQGRLLGRGRKVHVVPHPAQMALGPRTDPRRRSPAVAEQEFGEPVPRAQLILLGRLPRPHQVPKGLTALVGHPGGGRVTANLCPENRARYKTFTINPLRSMTVAGQQGHCVLRVHSGLLRYP
jgi:hypothetical protein